MRATADEHVRALPSAGATPRQTGGRRRLMRVASVTWDFPAADEPNVVNELNHFSSRGIACEALTEHVRPVSPAVERKLGGQVPIRACSADVLRGVEADLVYFEHVSLAVKYWKILSLVPAAKVVSCRGSDVRLDPLSSPRLMDLLTYVFGVVDLVHCVSAELAQHCLHLGARPEQLLISPIGVDLRTFVRPSTAKPEGLALRVITVARLDWVKGFDYALHAVKLLSDAGHRVTYTIVGPDQGALPAIKLAIRDFGLEEIVTVVGAGPPDAV